MRKLLSRLKQRLLNDRVSSSSGIAQPPPDTGFTLDPGVRSSKLDMAESGLFNTETREVMPGFAINEGDSVLDVGCGDAPFTAFCASMGADLFFCDIDEPKIVATSIKLQNPGVGGVGSRGGFVTNGFPLPLADASIEKIMMLEVLEHVDSPTDYVAELVRVAKPGALFLLTVPDARAEMIQKELAPDSYFQKPNHIRVFEREDFQKLIIDSGLEIERTDFYGFYWSVWWCMFWACNHDLMEPWHPVLLKWTETWNALLELEGGPKIKRALDRHLPKSQVIIARKPMTNTSTPL